MPAAFAHDLYGRKVYMEADPVIKRIIKKERYCFLLGVHGPDILFFYKALGKNKVNQKGVRMHGEPAAKLMERGRMLVREAEAKDERDEMIAYLMGVACHFCLDNRVHAYVNAEEKRTGITHAEIETELERRLLEREHMRPLHSNLTCHLKITAQTVRASSRLFDEDPIKVAKAIMSFRTMNRLFINSRERTKRFCCFLLRFTGSYGVIHGMFMRKQPTPGCEAITDYLEREFHEAVPKGAELLSDLLTYLRGKGPMPEIFQGNFNGE